MAAELPDKPPTWATDPGVTVEPSEGEKAAGYQQGFRPPARWDNYQENNTFRHIEVFRNMALGHVDIYPATNPTDDVTTFGISSLTTFKGIFYGMELHSASGRQVMRSVSGGSWATVTTANLGAGAVPLHSLVSNGNNLVLSQFGEAPRFSDADGQNFQLGTLAAPPDNFDYAAGTLPGAYFTTHRGTSNWLRSQNDGATWFDTGLASNLTSQIAVASSASTIVLLVGVDVYVSTDNGTSFNSSAHGAGPNTATGIFYLARLDRFVIVTQLGNDFDFFLSDDNTGTSYTQSGVTLDSGGNARGMVDIGGRVWFNSGDSMWLAADDFSSFQEVTVSDENGAFRVIAATDYKWLVGQSPGGVGLPGRLTYGSATFGPLPSQ